MSEAADVIETLAALVIAHVAADFVLQTRWMALQKSSAAPLLAHVAVVWVASWACLGCASDAVLPVTGLALVHLATDLAKARVMRRTALAFGLDQTAHLLTVLAVAVTCPDLWQAGVWPAMGRPADVALTVGLMAMGAVFALRGGFYFADHVVRDRAIPRAPPQPPIIARRDLIVNGMIFAGMLALPLATVAAGVLRVGALVWWPRPDAASTPHIVGRAAALGWAVCTGLGTLVLLRGLVGLDASLLYVYLPG